MIGVIADDLSGAAELGGVGLRLGLRAEILVGGAANAKADLVCLDTNSRLCSPEEAGRRAALAASRLCDAGAKWFYKKVDSVLRGQVTAELEAVMQQLGVRLALLIPANPSLGRIIRGGRYFINSRPLEETEFSQDPAYPRTSSEVLELLAAPRASQLCTRGVKDSLPDGGIVVGEVETAAGLRQWAARRVPGALLAGGAEFFGAVLEAEMPNGVSDGLRQRPAALESMAGCTSSARVLELFVCGSASESVRNFVRTAIQAGTPVFSLPEEVAAGAEFTASLAQAIARQAEVAFAGNPRVILQVGLPAVSDRVLAGRLSGYLVQVAETVLRQAQVQHVYVEGGETAVGLVRRMGWERLEVLRELALGVVTLRAEGPTPSFLTIKPGTYAWPDDIRSGAISSQVRDGKELVPGLLKD